MQLIIGTKTYDVDPSTSIETLVYQVENTEFLPYGSFLLKKGGMPLDDLDMTLESYGIVDEDDELTLTLQVPGGMRRKWKKKRMRRLRRKRRKMRQRAR